MASPYDVAIHLSLVSNVAEGIAAIVSRLSAADIGVKKLESGLSKLKPAVIGAVSAFAGFEMIKGVKAIADHAKDLSHELTQIQKLGISPAQFDQAKAAAFATPGQVPGMTTVDALKIYGQIYSPLGHENSLKMLKPLSEFVQAVGNTTGNYKAAEDKVYNMVRAGDLMGKFMNSMTHQVDITKLQHFLDLGARVIQATHGRVGADQWFALAQQGGPALSNMTDQGLLTMAMITQAMGGGRAGTALSSLFTQFQGGIMTKWRAQKLMELGILDKNAVEEVSPGGHIIWSKGKEPGTTPFARAMAEDPLKAIGILQSAMATHGYPTIEKQVPLLFELFQRQTSIREIHDLLRNMPQLQQERERITAGLGISASANLQNTQDYTQVMHNAAEAWNDMMSKIGLPVTIAAIPIMKRMTAAFLEIGTLATLHPEAIEHIATGITVLGAALLGGGGVAMLAALGPTGWIAAGVIAAGAAMALYKNPIMTWLKSFAETNWNEEITKALEPAIKAIKEWFSHLGAAIMDSLSGMWNDMKRALHLISFGGGGGGGFGGGGVTNTSWGNRGAALSAGERGQYASMIRQYGGDEASNLLKIYGTEGASSYYGDYVNGRPTSFGPFQSHFPGIANQMLASGIDVRDKSTVRAQIEWMRDYGHRQGGYSSDIWHGLRGHGGSLRSGHHAGGETHVHNNIYLDGKIIAKSTSKHLVRAAQYPTSVGRQDGRGTFMGPGAEVFA